MLLALPDVPLRTASFSPEDRWLLWSRARLYADRLTLSGIGLWDRYWRTVPLDEIEQVKREDECLRLQLKTDEEIPILLAEPERWQTAIRAHREVYDANR